jgi:hypothetical protein
MKTNARQAVMALILALTGWLNYCATPPMPETQAPRHGRVIVTPEAFGFDPTPAPVRPTE